MVSCVLAGCGGSSSGTLTVAVTSSVGSVLVGASCRQGATAGTVVATGRVGTPSTRRLTLSLAVYSAAGATLDLEGAPHTADLAVGERRWRVEARVVRGFPPARCVVAVTAAELVQEVEVLSSDMSPTISPGDSVVVDLSARSVAAAKPGEIVLLRPPPGAECGGPALPERLERVVALPGQSVQGEGGAVTVDGEPLAEPWLPRAAAARTGDFGPLAVPPGDLFVLGDDRADACDSRSFGPLPGTDLLGTVIKVVDAHPNTTTTAPSAQKATTPAFTT